MQTSTQEKPKCPKCGSDVYSRGHEIFAKPPHKRKKYSCKTCGHPFAEKIDAQKEVFIST